MVMRGNQTLQHLLAQRRADRLAEAALSLAHDLDPGVDIQSYLQRLQFYADAVSERLSPYAPLGDVLFQLNDYLFNDRGFYSEGAIPYRLDCNLLHRVIDNRCGVPLCLAVIYLTVGRWLGLPLVGMTFPGRILIKYIDEEGEVVLDPAEGGMPLQETDLAMLLSRTYAPAGVSTQQLRRFLSTSDDKTLLVRMLRQLKQSYLMRGDLQHALWALEIILQLTPEQASGFRERGYLYEMLDCGYAAAEDYHRYLELLPDASDAERLRKRLPLLLQRPVTLH
jgi:regulator of sirC expression with transglutaminase-like and TPR domain